MMDSQHEHIRALSAKIRTTGTRYLAAHGGRRVLKVGIGLLDLAEELDAIATELEQFAHEAIYRNEMMTA